MSNEIPTSILSATHTKTVAKTHSKSIRLPLELLADLEELAKREKTNTHAYMLSVLANHVVVTKYTPTK